MYIEILKDFGCGKPPCTQFANDECKKICWWTGYYCKLHIESIIKLEKEGKIKVYTDEEYFLRSCKEIINN